jgi:hypothetical protein
VSALASTADIAHDDPQHAWISRCNPCSCRYLNSPLRFWALQPNALPLLISHKKLDAPFSQRSLNSEDGGNPTVHCFLFEPGDCVQRDNGI